MINVPRLRWKEQSQKRRKHIVLPWIADPTKGASEEHCVFAQRHEANPVELFFDLFFVANLATFTAYHTITERAEFLAYVEFFGLLWGTWFAITLHDVRFAIDSVYERACKAIQLIVYVGFALVGSQFQPGGDAKDDNNTNFRVLCVLLAISRAVLAIQYLVVLVFCMKARFNKLLIPLGLNSLWYLITTAVFATMTLAFKNNADYHPHIYLVWYIAMALEVISVIAVSITWRMLSFKKTHLVERMGLLTLIVIGEGAVGVTKTVSIVLGKHGPDSEGTAQVFAIIMIIFFLFMIYFDNAPKGHFGTIRQQIWALLHFPLHLSIVGLVEGSQQLVRARYTFTNVEYFFNKLFYYCNDKHYDGDKLKTALEDTVKYFQLSKKPETAYYLPDIYKEIDLISATKGVCSDANVLPSDDPAALLPGDFEYLYFNVSSAIYSSTGVKLPKDKHPLIAADDAWYVTYFYYWGAFIMLVFVSMLCLGLGRRAKIDIFSWLSQLIRLVVLVVACGVIAAGATNGDFYANFTVSPWIVPSVVILLFVVVSVDIAGRSLANWRLRKSGVKDYVDDNAEEHGHGGEHGHDAGHGHAHGSHDEHDEKDVSHVHTAHMSMASYDTPPVGYGPVGAHSRTPSYAAEHALNTGYMSPPMMVQSPPVGAPTTQAGGYTAGTNTGYFPPSQQVS